MVPQFGFSILRNNIDVITTVIHFFSNSKEICRSRRYAYSTFDVLSHVFGKCGVNSKKTEKKTRNERTKKWNKKKNLQKPFCMRHVCYLYLRMRLNLGYAIYVWAQRNEKNTQLSINHKMFKFTPIFVQLKID